MCGIVSVFGSPEASQETYQGLLLLQHRGQDAAGILSLERGADHSSQFYLKKKKGLVDQVFRESSFHNKLRGDLALGHTRYSTIGLADERDLQPLTLNYPHGLGMIHNGNLVNAQSLGAKLAQEKRRHLFSHNDLEVILNLFADGLVNHLKSHPLESPEDVFPALCRSYENICQEAKGGYSVIGCAAHMGLFAFRDPHGIRPLILGERELTEEEKQQSPQHFGKSYCLSSESNVLTYLGYQKARDLKPGEMIFINYQGELQSFQTPAQTPRPCMFEWVYFANPETVMEKQPVYASRLEMGQRLAVRVEQERQAGTISPDIVVPVPETSRPSAIALAETLGIAYREILVKNRYIQRSFILNTQAQRSRAVNLKLLPVREEFEGKKVLLVDDSIVRGTTSKRLVKMVREAGAKEVYFASTCPPIRHPCYYGIDFPDPKELVATGRSEEEIAEVLGADKVIYLSLGELKNSLGRQDLCTACLDGKYPVDVSEAQNFRNHRRSEV